MSKIKKGDYIKITKQGAYGEGCIFQVKRIDEDGDIRIDNSEFGGNNDWYIRDEDYIIMDQTDINAVRIGDIITNGEDFRMVLDIYGTNSVDVSTTEDEILDIEDLECYLEDGKYIHYFKQELKNDEYRIYYPEEEKDVEELTMSEVCKELGRTIKIKK